MLVHQQTRQVLSKDVVFPHEFDDVLVTDLLPGGLPQSCRPSPASKALPHLGDHWNHTQASAIVRVPSVVVDSEFNLLLNPAPPEFSKIRIGKMRPLVLDPRWM